MKAPLIGGVRHGDVVDIDLGRQQYVVTMSPDEVVDEGLDIETAARVTKHLTYRPQVYEVELNGIKTELILLVADGLADDVAAALVQRAIEEAAW